MVVRSKSDVFYLVCYVCIDVGLRAFMINVLTATVPTRVDTIYCSLYKNGQDDLLNLTSVTDILNYILNNMVRRK